MRLATLLLCAVAASAQTTAIFTPQFSYGSITLWQVDVKGANHNISIADIKAAAGLHKIGLIDPALLQPLVSQIQGSNVIKKAEKVCTIAASGTAVSAWIKGQADWQNNPTANQIAGIATGVAGVCGLLLPNLQKQEAGAPPAVALLGIELTISSAGSGSGLFWSRQGGEAFTEVIK